jgi:hypothetical protein
VWLKSHTLFLFSHNTQKSSFPDRLFDSTLQRVLRTKRQDSMSKVTSPTVGQVFFDRI